MSYVAKDSLDKVLVERGFCSSRVKAQALIMSGNVLVADQVCDKGGTRVAVDADIRIRGQELAYVSRGGLKLEHALNEFKLQVEGRIAVDVGASTGGFTDCLLQRGARKVFAVDVGYGQLAWKLREDVRVVNLERTNIRNLSPDLLQPRPDLAVIDASFISLDKVLPPTLNLLAASADLVVLVKPQFEVAKGRVGKGGIVRDPSLHQDVMRRIELTAASLGLLVLASCQSPVVGAKGNIEFLMHLKRPE
ncbi:MAG: TlyA family RNA methyltransferase [Desulfuromonadaceae bacterium]|nr:TlyA family RNA methyltransferase [Desulfuromonas sp.]MDY0185222.1 TlyA family RNA methyltransferase [Desulfuromonadaceae bacterium]